MSDKNTKTFHADGGKGDRPRGTGWKNYYDNFDNIFGKKDEDLKISGGVLGHGMDAPPALQVPSLSDLGGKDVGSITTGNIECDPNVVWKIDAEGCIVKESGCNTEVEVVNDVSEADEG